MSELVDTLAATSPYDDDPAKLTIEAQKLAINTNGGTVARFQARISACNRIHHRIQRELFRLEKNHGTSAPSQKSLKTGPQPDTANVQQQPPANAADIGHKEAPYKRTVPEVVENRDTDIHRPAAPPASRSS